MYVRFSAAELTLLALVVLPSLHTGEGSGTADKLVRELALVLLLATIDLVVGLVRFAWIVVSIIPLPID